MEYEYEDELDRMRARGNRRKNGNAAGRRKPHPAGTSRERAQRQRKRRRRRRLLLVELVVLIAVLSGAYLFHRGGKGHDSGYWTIAVFGVDSRDGNLGKGALSDVEMICNIDKATGEIKLVSVYRDTYLKIDQNGTYDKINEAYFKGGHKQAIEALNENLDLQIDDYAVFNWKAVADAINILGGIDLEITDKEFKYINSFITETVESTGVASHHLEHAGMNHLDGVQAVAYARLRLMDTDFNRTERQRKVVSLAMEKAKGANFSVLNNVLVVVLPQVKTSVGLDDLIPIAKGFSSYHLGETGGFPFSRTTMKISKKDCVIPTTLESNVVQLHQFLFGDMEYAAPASVKKISRKISEVSGIGEPGENAPSGGTGKKESGKTKAVETTGAPEPETSAGEVTEEVTEESVQETTAEETAVETSEETPTNEDGSLIGPGAEIDSARESAGEAESPAPEPKPLPEPSTAVESKPEVEGPGSPGPSPDKNVPEAPAETEVSPGPGAAVEGPGAA